MLEPREQMTEPERQLVLLLQVMSPEAESVLVRLE
jgi:hypothetical protein